MAWEGPEAEAETRSQTSRMYSQFSLVRFSSVALAEEREKVLVGTMARLWASYAIGAGSTYRRCCPLDWLVF